MRRNRPEWPRSPIGGRAAPQPEWRNGRRRGLKILRWQHRAGSTPASGTIDSLPGLGPVFFIGAGCDHGILGFLWDQPLGGITALETVTQAGDADREVDVQNRVVICVVQRIHGPISAEAALRRPEDGISRSGCQARRVLWSRCPRLGIPLRFPRRDGSLQEG